jgi:hypothetical protein
MTETGERWSHTTNAPTMPFDATQANTPHDQRTRSRRRGSRRRAPATVATASRPTAALSIRLANSTMAWPSLADRGVKLSGSQRGHVEHPRPDPVSRTPAPTTVMTTRATSVTRTRVRNADGDRWGSRTAPG